MDISRLVQNPEDVRRDMNEAVELVREHFRAKYLRRAQKAVADQRRNTLSNPPREVALMSALKEFAPPNKRNSYERATEVLLALDSWGQMRKGLEGRVSAASLGDESVHRDGVYDIDKSCLNSSNAGERFAEVLVLMSIISSMKTYGD